jgi:hypothetical protein
MESIKNIYGNTTLAIKRESQELSNLLARNESIESIQYSF